TERETLWVLHSTLPTILRQQPLNMDRIRKERHMKIACIGAGASGLCFAYKLQRSFEDFTLTLFERNDSVGGVWVANRYPGCVLLSLLFPLVWADWTSVYAGAEEVQHYFEDFAQKHGLHEYCKFGTTVKRAQWDDATGRWGLQLQTTGGPEWEESFDILINASGLLSSPKWPEIPGLDEFGGLLLHSAAWPARPVELKGKHVGLIGNGSSGQQLLPALQATVGKMTVFIRQPTWVLGPFGAPPRSYSAVELQGFAQQPEKLLEKRKQFENRVNSYFGICLKDSPQQAALRRRLTQKILDQLAETKYADSAEAEAGFVPQYAVGCRRPTPGVGYIESLAADNVTLVVGAIGRATADGIVDQSGRSHPPRCAYLCDRIRHVAPAFFPYIGSRWQRPTRAVGPRSDCLSSAGQCPTSPTTSSSTGQTTHSLVALSWPPSGLIQTTVWADHCGSWYKASPSDPAKASLWPGSGLHYVEAISSLRGDDFDVRYRGNRWNWLGNGFSQVEVDQECDLSYYIRQQDDTSDLVAVLIPQTLFVCFSALSGQFVLDRTRLTLEVLCTRLPYVVSWIWLHLLVLDLANQRLPDSVAEDRLNKPWRPIPAGHLTSSGARDLLVCSITLTFMLSVLLLGGVYETLLLFALNWIYNDLGLANGHWLLRNLMNALGITTIGAGALDVAHHCGLPFDAGTATDRNAAYPWFMLCASVLMTTIHAQDLYDQVGDAARGAVHGAAGPGRYGGALVHRGRRAHLERRRAGCAGSPAA
ncbi:FAD/NAD(P)-binding domain-containing protein, partial [Apiospora kogelbergensis]|uniref:FAD/NAD(P)-binding domain-containing protein n=1 Tax=Apiospora kogelbergensis TaxID=1337665 RepID=UPI00312F7E8A